MPPSRGSGSGGVESQMSAVSESKGQTVRGTSALCSHRGARFKRYQRWRTHGCELADARGQSHWSLSLKIECNAAWEVAVPDDI